jgi:heterodisulfide reductase subunit C
MTTSCVRLRPINKKKSFKKKEKSGKNMEAKSEFRKKVENFHIEPDVIKSCYNCSKCSDNCPITAVTTDAYTTTGYNPRGNFLMTLLGHDRLLLGGDDLVVWGCTVCVTCDEVCPENIELTEIFTFLKNQSVALGKGPEFVYTQTKTVFENGKAIPSQPAIERRREQLGLPKVSAPDVDELQSLLKNMGIEKKLK